MQHAVRVRTALLGSSTTMPPRLDPPPGHATCAAAALEAASSHAHAPLPSAPCRWWHAPVVVGGVEGSGTRGAVVLLKELGVHMIGAGPLRRPTDMISPIGDYCRLNYAGDTTCVRPPHAPSATLREQQPSNAAFVAAAAAYRAPRPSASASVRRGLNETIALTARPSRTRRALAAIATAQRRPWRWGWKMPHTLWQLPALREIFPCLHFVHVVRDPRDIAAHWNLHVFIRAQQAAALAASLDAAGARVATTRGGARATTAAMTHKSAARLLCGSDAACDAMIRKLPSQNVHKQSAGQATKEYISVVRADAAAVRAVQCLHLLAWPINSLVAEWAPVGLRERGAYLRYQSELQAGDPAAHAAMAAALANGTLRADPAEAAAMRARAAVARATPPRSTRTTKKVKQGGASRAFSRVATSTRRRTAAAARRCTAGGWRTASGGRPRSSAGPIWRGAGSRGTGRRRWTGWRCAGIIASENRNSERGRQRGGLCAFE